MQNAARELEARIAMLQGQTAATVEALHHVRARTTRVLAATSAFTKLNGAVGSLDQVVRTLGRSRASEDSVDKESIERAIERLQNDLHELRESYSKELLCAAESSRPPPRTARRGRWWHFWR